VRHSDFAETDAFAPAYDETVAKYGWTSPEVLFGLLEEYLTSGDRLLDLGIGTGLSAVPFRRKGVDIFGIDASGGMLAECEKKAVAVELKQHDIRTSPIPYHDSRFEHVIASGVFHLICDLAGIIAEAARLLNHGGFFAFTIEEARAQGSPSHLALGGNVEEVRNKNTGIRSYRHGRAFVEDLLRGEGFGLIRVVDFNGFEKTPWADERPFLAFLARKTE